MADRTSAILFGKFFGLLAKNPTDEHKEIAREIYEETFEYDFSTYQMDADESLTILGLASIGVDPLWPDDGETTIYAKIKP